MVLLTLCRSKSRWPSRSAGEDPHLGDEIPDLVAAVEGPPESQAQKATERVGHTGTGLRVKN